MCARSSCCCCHCCYEISRWRWPYELYDSPLNLPRACFQLFNKLDAWLPGWRTVAHKLPAVFDPKSVDVRELRRAIDGTASVTLIFFF
jgi:hypothetical protein